MKPFRLPNLQPNQPVQVGDKIYTIQAIRITGYRLWLKVWELQDYFMFDETKMQCNYKEYKK